MKIFTQFSDELEDVWNLVISQTGSVYPFYSFAWHKEWYLHFGNEDSLVLGVDNDTHTIFPLSIHDHTAHFTGGEEISDYLDAIGPEHSKASGWDHMLAALRDRSVTHVILRNIPEGSDTLSYFRSLPTVFVTKEDTTPILTIPDTFEQYLAALPRKDRHEIRRKMKRFENEHPDLRVHMDDVYDSRLLFTLMRNNPDKTTFLTSHMQAFFQNLDIASGSTLRQATLHIDNKPVATTISFLTKSSLLLYNSGYVPDVVGSGWYLKAWLIQWCVRHTIQTMNYLQGNERYKYDFGAKDSFVYRIELQLGT